MGSKRRLHAHELPAAVSVAIDAKSPSPKEFADAAPRATVAVPSSTMTQNGAFSAVFEFDGERNELRCYENGALFLLLSFISKERCDAFLSALSLPVVRTANAIVHAADEVKEPDGEIVSEHRCYVLAQASVDLRDDFSPMSLYCGYGVAARRQEPTYFRRVYWANIHFRAYDSLSAIEEERRHDPRATQWHVWELHYVSAALAPHKLLNIQGVFPV